MTNWELNEVIAQLIQPMPIAKLKKDKAEK